MDRAVKLAAERVAKSRAQRWVRAMVRTLVPAAVTLVSMEVSAQVVGTDSSSVVARDLHEEIVRIDVTVKDMYGREETRRMPITIFRPDGDGPFPLVVFNHGRAPTAKRAAQGRSRPEHLARYLVAKGFVVMAPTRIGYWENYGDFDPEDNGRCNDLRVDGMARAAADQVIATVAYAQTLSYVDTRRWIVAGQSVGGLTSVATVARSPAGLVGGINFSGGTGGNPDTSPGAPCSPKRVERLYASLGAMSAVPMAWLYWPNDRYFGADVPVSWYRAWSAAGGRGTFDTFPAIGEDGHAGLNIDMDHWLPVVDRFLADLGFTTRVVYQRPAATGYAPVADVDRLPSRNAAARAAYAKFLEAKAPRAFAVGDRGGYGWSTADYVIGHALGFCRRSGQNCRLYAVDDEVVW